MSLEMFARDAPRPHLQLEPLTDSLGMVHPTHYVCHDPPHDHAHNASSLLLAPHLNFPGLPHL